MRSSGSSTLSLPPFAGVTRQLILVNAAVYFGILLLQWLSPQVLGVLVNHLWLEPLAVIRGEVWQPLTYSFINLGLLGVVFALLTLWFAGSLLEGACGGRWVAELYGTSVVGGAVIATAVSFMHIPFLRPDVPGAGAWSGVFGLLMGIAVLFGDQEFLLWFVLRLKAKYMVAIYILIAMAQLLKDRDSFGALLQLSGALCGYLFVRFAPRRGLAFGMSERYFGLRNGYYRWKRRRAARKFEVYMGKQGRKVHFDKDGRYIDPDEARKDPNDKRWMN
jgi:membrane associated rhomboid family serine protease